MSDNGVSGQERPAPDGTTGPLIAFLRRTVLCRPSGHVGLAPNAARGKFADGLREALGARKLVGALLAHAEHLSNLCHSHEFHGRECMS